LSPAVIFVLTSLADSEAYETGMKKDVIVIGGGAAGLFCAIHAGKRGRSVLVIERSERAGKKIAISGGGRCNFTNINTSPADFICGNPHFHKSALARFTPDDIIRLVEENRIGYHDKKLGQLFCNGSAQKFVRMLLQECSDAGAEISLNCHVRQVEKDNLFRIETNLGSYECESLVVATGGLSIPKIGATDFGFRVARQFGLNVRQTKPGLVPLTLSDCDLAIFNRLSGVSLDARVKIGDHEFRGNVLITHRGLSGPAILQISSYWDPFQAIEIDLLPGCDTVKLLAGERESPREVKTVLGKFWPQRFANAWTQAYAESKPLGRYSNSELLGLAERVHRWKITPSGTEGYCKAEVTAGGVDTDELYSQTMEARGVPGLYFVGEVVDVTGHLGGFNLQWAWASGYAAGQFV
jgi:predicted Rossmann fold flavoprotein